MYYTEKKQNLFSVDINEYSLVHCISADFAFNKGLALEMQKVYKIRDIIQQELQPFAVPIGRCLYTKPIFNLITEGRSQNTPTYETIYECLYHLNEAMDRLEIYKIAMPLLGCGLGQLKWPIVRALIKDIFEDRDIEILVCYLEGQK